MKALMDSLFQWNVRNKNMVIDVFKIGYFLILVLLIITAYLISQNQRIIGIYTVGELSGKIALVLFCITITPGILRRFSIRGTAVSLLMLYRRHLGISTFVFAFYHYASISLFSVLFRGSFVLVPSLFEGFGVVSLYTMSVLFFSSNSWSVQNLGKWWGRLHALIYIIAWTIFLHVFLQGISRWSLLMGGFAIVETLSLVYYYFVKSTKPPIPPIPPIPPPEIQQATDNI